VLFAAAAFAAGCRAQIERGRVHVRVQPKNSSTITKRAASNFALGVREQGEVFGRCRLCSLVPRQKAASAWLRLRRDRD
jgi:hypothetical protein